MMLLALQLLMTELIPAQNFEVPAGEVLEIDDLAEVGEMGTVKLGENSELQLPSFRSLRIRQLIAKDGARIKLANSSSGQSGEFSVNGGDGSDGVFLFDKVDGHVIIESRGGDGGAGRDGVDGQQGQVGGKGRNGIWFLFFYLSEGEDGKPGQDGEPGANGEDGGRGGNGGKVKVFYRTKTPNSQILVDVAAGRGGVGGKAGHGGLGGPGGPGGRGTRPGAQGPMGRAGENGKPGRPGEPGFPGKAEIYQVDADLYRCLLQKELLGMDWGDLKSCVSQ